MDPLIIENIITSPYLSTVVDGDKKVLARPNEKIVLCAIARCQESRVSMETGITINVRKGAGADGHSQKQVCDLLKKSEAKITVALIARLCGYSWNHTASIVARLKRLKVVDKDLRIFYYPIWEKHDFQ